MAKIKRANKFAIVPITICSDPDISHVALRVYAALKSFANRDDGEAWPSQELLADRASLSSPESLRRPLKQLEEKGWIRKTRKGRPGRTRQFVVNEKPHNGTDNDYASTEHLVDSCGAQCTPLTDHITDHVTNQASTEDWDQRPEQSRRKNPPFSERECEETLLRLCNGLQPGFYSKLASNHFKSEQGYQMKNLRDLEHYLKAKMQGQMH